MASGNKVNEDEFRAIKSKLKWSTPEIVAQQMSRHLAIIVKVQAAKDFEHYKRIVKAEHPPVKNSLADRVSELENRMDLNEADVQRLKTEKASELNSAPAEI